MNRHRTSSKTLLAGILLLAMMILIAPWDTAASNYIVTTVTPSIDLPTPTGEYTPGFLETESNYVLPVLSSKMVSQLQAPLLQAVQDGLTNFNNKTKVNGRAIAIELNAMEFDGQVLAIDLGNPPKMRESQWGDLLHTIDLEVMKALYEITNLQGINIEYYFLLYGKPLDKMLPQSTAPSSSASSDPLQSINSVQGKSVVINPGHGYYTKSTGGWFLQRGYQYGIVEDFINLDLAIDLNRFISASGGTPRPERQLNKGAGNHSSGKPWWQMDASEYVRSVGAPISVWKPLPYDNTYNHDIAARPEYANWIGASSMVSIHNNGGGSSACNGHGTETWYDTGNGYATQSKDLATAIHSKIIQRIREGWDPNWCDRGVKGANGNYGENRRFRGPAVLVELAFMNVQSDNSALQNSSFRAIAMAAINEGLVQYYGGVSCPSVSEWRGEYWNNRSLNGYPVMCRNDGNVNFDWGTGNPGGSVLSDKFSARWTRSINFSGGNYRFHVKSDDGIRLWIDGSPAIDKWFDQGPTEYTVDRNNFSAGSHSIKIEYYENGGGAVAKFWYESLGISCPNQYKAEYFNNKTLSGSPTYVRCEGSINYDWGSGGPGNGIGNDNFSVRWTGSINFSGGNYRFHVKSDDGIRLWIDGSPAIDKWFDQGPTEYTADRYNFSAGSHSIKIEYYENGGGAVAKFWYESLGVSCPNQYKAEYFNNKTLSGSPTYVRCENWPINWDWGSGGPGNGIGNDNFSARWTGQAYINSGNYTFIARTDDGMRVWLDGGLIIDKWYDQAPTEHRVTRSVSAGNHSIKVEYYENGGGAVAQFRWEPATSANLALNRPSYSTSNESSSYTPNKGNDGSTSTRWSSAMRGVNEWWWVDLGSAVTFDHVQIRWETAYSPYAFIGWSSDGQYFTGYYFNTPSAGYYSYNLGTRTYRYAGIMMITRAPCCGNFSFWEFEVVRTSSAFPLRIPGLKLVEPDGDLQTVEFPVEEVQPEEPPVTPESPTPMGE